MGLNKPEIIYNSNSYKVAQVKPCPRMISIAGGRGRVYLPFPYILFAFECGNFWVGFSNKPVSHDYDPIFFPPLGNMYPSFKCCLGVDVDSIEKAIKYFWLNQFGGDGAHYNQKLNEYINWTFEQDATKINWPVATNFQAFKKYRENTFTPIKWMQPIEPGWWSNRYATEDANALNTMRKAEEELVFNEYLQVPSCDAS